jgi:hypothetical protein
MLKFFPHREMINSKFHLTNKNNRYKQMKEYKVIKKGFWTKDQDFEVKLNQIAREGWEVINAIGDGNGNFSKVILERDKNRMQ